ncbi:benzoylformate decarboxylase [Nocardia sp. NPDC052316]|uniref:benzoylformate decarboxylase n=1 Tax=Nocardia sp. NPDC052316 TaxID=3364329 RepID=UPI0037C984EC
MKTVRAASFEVLRAAGMTTMFGNPGSNELPFLQDFPDDFRYVLALHEGAALGMADGYSQAIGEPVLVSLHSAAGVGQAMGNLVNSAASGTPLVLLSGQQRRELLTLQGVLANVDATTLPKPLVKWSFEAPSAQSVPAVLARAIVCATTAPTGPVYVSVPLEDWNEPADTDNLGFAVGRAVAGRPIVDSTTLRQLAARLDHARNPVLVVGPQLDTDAGWKAAVALADKAGLPVMIGTAEYHRLGFPTGHPRYQGTLGVRVDQAREQLAAYDFVLWVGGAVLPYHAWTPGPYVSGGTELVLVTADADQAARSPLGGALVGDPADALSRLADYASARTRPLADRSHRTSIETAEFTQKRVVEVLAAHAPRDAVYINETPSLSAIWDDLPITRPRSYLYPAAAGLGYGLPAAVGCALAQPDRPVIALIGDGSANYSISGLWTAAQHRLDITYVIIDNGAYRALQEFGEWLDAPKLPGLDLPGLDFVALAQGYGIPGTAIDEADTFAMALDKALSTPGPHLIQAKVTAVASGMFD